ncbi:MAG: hypothetical protein AB7E46_07230 [Desulfovibrio sp.]
MHPETFRASTQYGDMKGTACADKHDSITMLKFLEAKGHINSDESIVGITMFSGEVHQATQDNKIYVSVDVIKAPNFEAIKERVDSGKPLPVRRIKIKMHLNEFFGLFKRFEVCISGNGLLNGKEIEVLESTDVE